MPVLGYDARGSGPTLLLVHGFPLDRAMWDAVLEPLAHTSRVIAVDLRGRGKSQRRGWSGLDARRPGQRRRRDHRRARRRVRRRRRALDGWLRALRAASAPPREGAHGAVAEHARDGGRRYWQEGARGGGEGGAPSRHRCTLRVARRQGSSARREPRGEREAPRDVRAHARRDLRARRTRDPRSARTPRGISEDWGCRYASSTAPPTC